MKTILFVFCSFGFLLQATPARGENPRAPAQPKAELEVSTTWQWVAMGAGGLYGFGLGQAIEGRKAWPFVVSDGVGWLFVLSGLGDSPTCDDACNARRSRNVGLGAGILLTSRVLQIVDLVRYGEDHELFSRNEKPYQILTLPTDDGKGLQANVLIRF